MPEDAQSGSEESRADDAPRFEDALEELQEIVGELEDGSLGLEESMQRFERGLKLLGSCYRYLEEAEKRIEMLTGFDAEGNPQTQAFDAQATFTQGGKAGSGEGWPGSTAGSPRNERAGGSRRSTPATHEDEPESGGEAAGDGAAAEDEGETLF